MNKNLDGVVSTYVIMKYFIGGPRVIVATLGILSGATIMTQNVAELKRSLKGA